MFNTRHNFHRSKLPAIGHVTTFPPQLGHLPKGKVIVESYPLCDNVLPYSIGIHTVTVRHLGNGQRYRIAGYWLMD